MFNFTHDTKEFAPDYITHHVFNIQEEKAAQDESETKKRQDSEVVQDRQRDRDRERRRQDLRRN